MTLKSSFRNFRSTFSKYSAKSKSKPKPKIEMHISAEGNVHSTQHAPTILSTCNAMQCMGMNHDRRVGTSTVVRSSYKGGMQSRILPPPTPSGQSRSIRWWYNGCNRYLLHNRLVGFELVIQVSLRYE